MNIKAMNVYGLNHNLDIKKIDGCGMDARYKIPISVDLEVFVGSMFFFKQKEKLFFAVYGYIVETISKYTYNSYPATDKSVDNDKLFRDNYRVILSAIIKDILKTDEIPIDSISTANDTDVIHDPNEHSHRGRDYHYFQVHDHKLYDKLKKIANDTLIPYHTYTIRYIANKNTMDIRRSIGKMYIDKRQFSDRSHRHTPYTINNEGIKGLLDIEYTVYIQANIPVKEIEAKLKKAIDDIRYDIKKKLDYYTILNNNLKKNFPISIVITDDRYRTEKEDRYE